MAERNASQRRSHQACVVAAVRVTGAVAAVHWQIEAEVLSAVMFCCSRTSHVWSCFSKSYASILLLQIHVARNESCPRRCCGDAGQGLKFLTAEYEGRRRRRGCRQRGRRLPDALRGRRRLKMSTEGPKKSFFIDRAPAQVVTPFPVFLESLKGDTTCCSGEERCPNHLSSRYIGRPLSFLSLLGSLPVYWYRITNIL
jgi:hypothetical protein